ncbi:MAG TPA: hypothetical protein VF607_12015, partial [Verrucomicrobiae bacterium]
ANTLAIKSDGSLWGWGGNADGQLGDGTSAIRVLPTATAPGRHWVQVAVGNNNSYGLKDDGTLWAWGGDTLHLGLETNAASRVFRPAQIGTDTNWTHVWTGDIQALGLKVDGSLWFWGILSGSGTDNTNIYTIPTRVSPDTNWVAAAFGYYTMLAIKGDGTLWTWGNEARFYAGSTNKAMRLVPERVGTNSDWVSISSNPGGFYHLLRKKDGSLWALDASAHRRILTDDKYPPITCQPMDLSTDIGAYASRGDDIGVVLNPAGEVLTWGTVLGEISQSQIHVSADGRSESRPPSRKVTTPWKLEWVR